MDAFSCREERLAGVCCGTVHIQSAKQERPNQAGGGAGVEFLVLFHDMEGSIHT
jgi:hypothetical protein